MPVSGQGSEAGPRVSVLESTEAGGQWMGSQDGSPGSQRGLNE